jgi:nicotinamide mononucleotide (NMN) deamidase PncC
LAAFTAVSQQVAEQMARGVLQRTDEADLAASVTGYLGPSSPNRKDGLVFVGFCRRSHGESPLEVHSKQYQLTQPERSARQREAAALVLQTVLQNA